MKITEGNNRDRMKISGLNIPAPSAVLTVRPAFHIAIATINRLFLAGLKRHPGSFAAYTAVYGEHLPARAEILTSILIFSMFGFSDPAAWGTTCRNIGETASSVKLLL